MSICFFCIILFIRAENHNGLDIWCFHFYSKKPTRGQEESVMYNLGPFTPACIPGILVNTVI